MNAKALPPPRDTDEEVSALIATLIETGQRLEELTAGEVDTVTDRDGRPFLLQHAQEHLRHVEAARQRLDRVERKRDEEALRRFAAAMDAIADAIYLVDRSTMCYVHVNEAACRLHGLTREELLALGPAAAVGISRAELERDYDTVIADGVAQPLEIMRRRPDGQDVWVEVRRHAQRSEDRWVIVALVRDVTERKRAEDRLAYLAYYDALTGLANRRLFLDRVAQYMRSAVGSGRLLAVCLLDLEGFKNINDSLGRPAGDALLVQVAQWLSRDAGDANLLARVGADQFAVVLPEVTQESAVARLLEKMMESFLEHPFHLNDTVLRVATKVGIAIFPHDGADADALLRKAEAALKESKASGDRYLFYTQNMTAAAAGRLSMENQLRQAVDREEFVLHYQPKLDAGSGKLTGAEALIRWNDPRTGLVPPGRFISLLEETDLIQEVGRWALRKAIEDSLRWRAAGLATVRIAVNVSPLQLRNRGFIEQIQQVIGIDAQAAAGLELEITESVIMEDVQNTIATLQAIRALGVSIAVDDFGTGFSSLSYLSKLPVDTLKIDQSFVREMTVTTEGLALVSTIIDLAHALKLKVVAEGVETEEQARLLRLLRCDEMQGYLFGKPMPGDAFEKKFLTHAPAA